MEAARTDLTIEELIRRCEVSVRLANCIAMSPEISQLTVSEFLADPARWLNQFLQTKNVGRNIANELSALVKAAAEPETFRIDPAVNQAPPRKVAFRNLVDLLKPIPFPAALLKSEISVRLRHCLERIEAARLTAESWEPETTSLGAVLAEWPRIRRKLLEQANLGRKTVTELGAVIETAIRTRLNVLRPSPLLPELRIDDLSESRLDETLIELLVSIDPAEHPDTLVQDHPPPRKVAFGNLIDLLKPIPFPAALLEIEISVRLRNCLETIQAARLTAESWEPEADNLGAVLAEWPRIRPKLLKQANLGRKTVAEFEAVIEKITRARVNACCPSAGLPETRIDDLSEGQLDETLIELLISVDTAEIRDILAQDHPELSTLLHGPDDDNLLPREHVREAVSRLTQKQQDVIARRYGLDGRRPETLEEVAAQFHVTRERVRQVEAKALERLKLGTSRRALERLLATEQEDVWNLLTQGHCLLMPADLQDRRSGIPGEFMLAVDVAHRRLIDWVANHGRAVLGGWYKGDESTDNIEHSVRRVRVWAATVPGPVPFASAAGHSGVPAHHLAIASRVLPDIREFEGYICPGHFGAQAKRTCRVHSLAVRLGKLGAFDVATLRIAYLNVYTDDKILPRVINLQMQRAPHLFFRLFDGMWIALDSGTDLGGHTVEEIPFERTPVPDETDFDFGSIGAWLHSTLATNGPMRTVDLRAAAEAGFQSKISPSSVGAILQSNDDFVRLAPGVYGLQRHVATLADPATPIPPSMLTDTQCRYYAMSRHAGDPISLYPAWSHRFEAALCRWASTSASEDNYRSMLAFCSISKWDVDPVEEAVWQERKRHHGSYRLPRPDPPHAPQLPSAADFLAAAVYLVLTGSIAWTTVNRTAQRRIDSQKAAATLALLVRFGMAAPTEPWQGRHRALPAAAAAVSGIIAELARTGRLSWNEGTLAELRNRPHRGYVGWIDVAQLERILSEGDEAADKGLMMGNGTPTDLDSIFGSDDWGAAFGSETD